VLTATWGISSARLLIDYPYGKDDVRTALSIAKTTELPILWEAGSQDAAYYGAYDFDSPQSEIFGVPPDRATEHWKRITPVYLLSGARQADADQVIRRFQNRNVVFVAGKADLFDPLGVWGKSVAAWHPRLINKLNGFEIWIVAIPEDAYLPAYPATKTAFRSLPSGREISR
jgi:hypothetical protein